MSNRAWYVTRTVLIAVVVAGLAIDAYVHLDLASDYDGVKTSSLTQGDLFRAEASIAIIAALLVALRPRRWTALIAFLVAAGGTALVLIYAYADLGALGPFPDMYDPAWYGEKTLSVVGEGVAAIAAAALLVGLHLRGRRPASGSSGAMTGATASGSTSASGTTWASGSTSASGAPAEAEAAPTWRSTS